MRAYRREHQGRFPQSVWNVTFTLFTPGGFRLQLTEIIQASNEATALALAKLHLLQKIFQVNRPLLLMFNKLNEFTNEWKQLEESKLDVSESPIMRNVERSMNSMQPTRVENPERLPESIDLNRWLLVRDWSEPASESEEKEGLEESESEEQELSELEEGEIRQ